ncbi:MAG: hypothetical protein FJX29_14190 [Alphaproteobacteria bacterium]|nr:hypothetical protein [Alphaproteobacteria bacterium]
MSFWLFAAAAVSAVTCLIHVFAGGRFVAGPLLQAEGLGRVAKYTAYYCWHLVSIMLAGMAALFLRAGLQPSAREGAVIALVFAVSALVWNLAIIRRFGLSALRFPQWALFALVSILGAAGILL